MRLLFWSLACLNVWILGAVYSRRDSGRKALWFLLANLGFGFCCLLLGMLTLENPPRGHPLWTRLLWSTLVLTVPAWVAFSQRFARPPESSPGDVQRVLQFLGWTMAAALLLLGINWPPLEVTRTAEGHTVMTLVPPIGRWVAIHILVGVTMLLWNLHATLEAARSVQRRRIAGAIYALLPLVMASLYLIAEFLLYNQQRCTSTDILLGATVVSTLAFAAVTGKQKRHEMDLPVGTEVVFSSGVLSALGVFFVVLVLLAETLRALGIEAGMTWYEHVIVGFFVVLFSLWILPGLRHEVGRFVDRKLYVPPMGANDTWRRVNLALASVDSTDDLAAAIRILFRERFGPLSVRLWVYEVVAGEFVPAEDSTLPRLGPRHPLIMALQYRTRPLLVSTVASRIEQIPLHAACEEMAEKHDLRVFFPMRSSGHLAAVMGCGPGVGRTLHPEDLELLQKIADRIAGRVAVVSGNEPTGRVEVPPEAESAVTLDELPLKPWLQEIISRARAGKSEAPRVRLLVRGPDRVRLDREVLEPMIYHLMVGILDPSEATNGEIPVSVTITPNGRMALDLCSGQTRLSLRLGGQAPIEQER